MFVIDLVTKVELGVGVRLSWLRAGSGELLVPGRVLGQRESRRGR